MRSQASLASGTGVVAWSLGDGGRDDRDRGTDPHPSSGWGHVSLPRLHTRVFGMEELFREGDDLIFLRTPGAWDTVTLNSEPDGGKGRPGDSGGIAHFGFRLKHAADMDDAVREIVTAGGRLVGRGEHSPGELVRVRHRPRRLHDRAGRVRRAGVGALPGSYPHQRGPR